MQIIVALVMLFVVSPILNGWALSNLWGWFVVPFFDAPGLSIPLAVGLSMTVSWLAGVHTRAVDKDDDDAGIVGACVTSVLIPIFVMFIGWIWHLFLP